MNRFQIALICALSLFPFAAWAEGPTEALGGAPLSKGKGFNPDTSVNFLGLWERGTALSSDRSVTPRNGFRLQEAEMQFNSDVDPYLKAVALFSVAQEDGSTGYGIDPEEVYLESISLPLVTLRAGKFKLALGKHNQLHTHAFPFIDAPLIHQQLLGEEGLNEVGISAAVLLPVSWYSEIVLQGFDPSNGLLYNSLSSGDVGGLAHLKNLWDLSEDLTFELGLSGTRARNSFAQDSSVLGADATFKWRPAVGGKYHALVWSSEYLGGKREGLLDISTGTSRERLGGFASWLQYQFAERWWIQARGEQAGVASSVGTPKQTRESALLGFFPSEFSGFRLQYDHLTTGGKDKADHTVALQYNISIGAHPAHAY
jgi:hypothetical protein